METQAAGLHAAARPGPRFWSFAVGHRKPAQLYRAGMEG